jgi:hypothetical protein
VIDVHMQWAELPSMDCSLSSWGQRLALAGGAEAVAVEARAAARQAGDIVLTGCLPEEDRYPEVRLQLGVYRLLPGLVNNRPVYNSVSEAELFIYYSNTADWLLSNRENMELGRAVGYARVKSASLTPVGIGGNWHVFKFDGTGWEEAVEMRVRRADDAEAGVEAEGCEGGDWDGGQWGGGGEDGEGGDGEGGEGGEEGGRGG